MVPIIVSPPFAFGDSLEAAVLTCVVPITMAVVLTIAFLHLGSPAHQSTDVLIVFIAVVTIVFVILTTLVNLALFICAVLVSILGSVRAAQGDHEEA